MQLLRAQNKMGEKASRFGADLPVEIITVAESKMNEFMEVKSEIYQQMTAIHEGLESVRQLIRANSNKEGSVINGVLTLDEARYLECIEV